MAYVEPAQGFHLPPRLPAAGEQAGPAVDLGAWSLDRLAALKGMSPEELAASYSAFGHNSFVAGFGGAGPEAAQLAQRAAAHLEHNLGRYIQPSLFQEPSEALARQREAVTQGKVAKELRDTPVPTPDWVFEQAGAKPGKVYADYAHLQRKHPDQFTSPDDVRTHVEYVMDRPEYFLPATKPEYTLLVRRNGADKVTVVEFQLRGGKYRVRSAHLLSEGQLERKLQKAADQGGSSGPPTPARSPLGEISSGSPTAPSNAVHLDPSDFMIEPPAGQVKPGPGHQVLGKTMGQTLNLGNLAPDESGQGPRLAGQIGKSAADWRPGLASAGEIALPFSPRAAFARPGTISREAAFNDLVAAGVLSPEQKLTGYVTHMGASARAKAAAAEAARLDQPAPELALQPMVPGFAKERLDKLGEAPRLDEALTTYRTAAETAKVQRGLLRQLGPMLLDKVPDETRSMGGALVKVPGNPAAKDLVRTRTEWSNYAGKEVTRQEPLSLVDIGPVEAEALGVQEGRYTIPTYFAERFDSLVGRIKSGQLDTPLTGLGELTRDLARYWKLNQLLAPATAVTNLLGGLTQYASKVGEDVVRFGLRQPGYTGRRVLDDLTAPVQALRPSMVERLPAEVLGGNVSTQFGRDASQFYKGVQARLEAGEKVNLSSRALGALANLTMKTVSLGLKPFGAIENYMKRAIYLSEVIDLARREARALKAKGTEVEPLDLVARMFQDKPELHRQVMQGAMDRFGYDYDNIPTWLKNFRDSTTGALTVPFPVYGYKYARAVLNQANALNPLNHGLPMSERLARGAGGEPGKDRVEAGTDSPSGAFQPRIPRAAHRNQGGG